MKSLPLARLATAAVLSLAFAAPAYPWGVEGHKAVAMLATQDLSADARAHVVALLGSDDLASVSVWMDELRSAVFHTGPLGQDPEALKFNAMFPRNSEWHYCDLPLGTQKYSLQDPFANPHDVVHMIEKAVDVLEHGDPKITKKEALYMLVHFVGDEHQPLHIGNGFIAINTDGTARLVTDRTEAMGLPNDKGGNDDFFGPGKYDELHAYWDSEIVWKLTDGRKDIPALAALIEAKAASDGASWKSEGDYHHWPEAWATESLAAARVAYAGVTFGAASFDSSANLKRIAVTLPPGYDDTCKPLAEERLAKAGYHLAEILNAIHWSD